MGPPGCHGFPLSPDARFAEGPPFVFMFRHLTIAGLTEALTRRECSAREALQACFDQIAQVDGTLRAFLSYDVADAEAQADAADRELAAASPRPQNHCSGFPWPSRMCSATRDSPAPAVPRSSRVSSPLRRHRGGPTQGSRCRGVWASEHGRVCHGQFH